MKKFFLLLLVCVVAVCTFVSCNAEVSIKQGWVAMVYMDMSNLPALNNLNEIVGIDVVNDSSQVYIMTGGSASAKDMKEYYGMDALNINGMDDGKYLFPNLRDGRVVAENPEDENYPFAPSSKPDTYQYWKLEKVGEETKLVEITSKFPQSMGMNDPVALETFMDGCYSLTDSPSTKKFLLDIWDHGGGSYAAVCEDFSSATYDAANKKWNGASDVMRLNELKEAIHHFTTEHNQKLECINFDVCMLSSVEVVYTFKDEANYINASETVSSGAGTNYNKTLSFLYNNPDASGYGLGTIFCTTAKEKISSTMQRLNVTWSMIDTSKATAFLNQYNAFMDYMTAQVSDPAMTRSDVIDKLRQLIANDPRYNSEDPNTQPYYLNMNYMFDLMKTAEVFNYPEAATLEKYLNAMIPVKELGDGVKVDHDVTDQYGKVHHVDQLCGLSLCMVYSMPSDNKYDDYAAVCLSDNAKAFNLALMQKISSK